MLRYIAPTGISQATRIDRGAAGPERLRPEEPPGHHGGERAEVVDHRIGGREQRGGDQHEGAPRRIGRLPDRPYGERDDRNRDRDLSRKAACRETPKVRATPTITDVTIRRAEIAELLDAREPAGPR